MSQNFTKYAFTDSVKEAQEKYGSRTTYARMEQSGDRYVLSDREAGFIESRDSFYMATVGENGWPYVQFRGGPIGFLKVVDETTLGMVDFRGNRQYISVGNIKPRMLSFRQFVVPASAGLCFEQQPVHIQHFSLSKKLCDNDLI